MKTHDLEREKVSRLFFSYAIPSMIAITVFSLYSLVDSIFVARVCGMNAITAVQLCSPIMGFFSALSTIVSVGGNTLIGIAIGKKETAKARAIFTLTLTILVAASALLMVVLLFLTKPVAGLLGANADVMADVCEYLRACGYFVPVYLLGGFLSLCLETEGKPAFAMIGNISMALSNIVLDYLFVVVWQKGVFGASVASGLSAMLGTGIFLIGLLRKKGILRPCGFASVVKLTGRMLYNGASEGITVLSTGIVAYVYNLMIMQNGGSDMLARYTITLAVVSFIGALLIGATQGINPIVSVNYGAGRMERLTETVKTYLLYTLILASVTIAAFSLLFDRITPLFGVDHSDDLWGIARAYAPIFLFTPCCVIVISFFTAINDAKTSAILSVLRGLVVRMIVIFALYGLFGINGFWYGATVSEMIMTLICFGMIRRFFKSLNSRQG